MLEDSGLRTAFSLSLYGQIVLALLWSALGKILSPKSYVDVPAGPQKFDFLYQFFAQFPTHQYTIFERNASNFDQIGCFLQ